MRNAESLAAVEREKESFTNDKKSLAVFVYPKLNVKEKSKIKQSNR